MLDANGHKEKLPRPALDSLSMEAVYDVEAEKKGSSTPTRTPSNGGHNTGVKNASRRFIWSTMDAIMIAPSEVASSLSIPFAALCCPFADGCDSQTIPLAEPIAGEGPLRCTRCRCYANPYFQWSSREQGRIQCNMCGHHNEVPEGFVEEMDRAAQNDEEHAEFSHGSVDYVAPECLDLDRPADPNVPATCFLLESSPAALASGLLQASLHAIERLLDDDAEPMHRQVCIMLFDDAVHFFELTNSGGFRRVTMCDLDDPFVPLGPQAIFCNTGDEIGRTCLRGLVQHLQTSAKEVVEIGIMGEQCSVAGSALRCSVDAVTQAGGGDVVIFHASTPSAGLGALSPPQTAAPSSPIKRGTSSAKLGGDLQQAEFYEETRRRCIMGGVAVSTVIAQSAAATANPCSPTTAPSPNDGALDLRTMQWLPWCTGGDVLHYPDFRVPETATKLTQQIRHWARRMQGSAYGCVFKLRCSKGLACTSMVAPWPAAASSTDSSAFELPRLSPDAAFQFTIRPEIDSSDDDDMTHRHNDRKKQLFVQAAILYTNEEGKRLLRIHTSLISIAFSVRAVYQSVSVGPLVTAMVKQAAFMMLEQKSSTAKKQVKPKDFLLSACLQILALYRRHCHTSSDVAPQSLVVSKTLALLPLYVLSARKLIYSVGIAMEQTGSDEQLMRLLRMPVHSVLMALYPRMFALPVAASAAEGAAAPEPPERTTLTPCPCLQEHVTKGPSPAYIITNGLCTWLYKTWPAGSLMDEAATSATRKMAEEAGQLIQQNIEPSPTWMPLEELPTAAGSKESSWQEKVRLATLFVEDEGGTDLSYSDWVEYLGRNLREAYDY